MDTCEFDSRQGHVIANREVYQRSAPCVLHKTHSPVTVVNELHHPFPQAWQKEIWGEVRDNRTVSVCATGHNSVHNAITYYVNNGKYPEWCVGKTRDIVEEAFRLLNEAQTESTP